MPTTRAGNCPAPCPRPTPSLPIAGNPGFTDYVKLLAHQADTSLAQANAVELAQAEAAFLRVATLEKAFWQMAYGEGVRV
jgi:hypothetical protein